MKPPLEAIIAVMFAALMIGFAVIFRACEEFEPEPQVKELPLPPLPPQEDIEFCSLKKTTAMTAEERRILCLHEINR